PRAHIPPHRPGERFRQRDRTGCRFQGSEGDGEGKNPASPGPPIPERRPSPHEHQRREHDRLDLGEIGGRAEGAGFAGAGPSAGSPPAGGNAHQRRDPAARMDGGSAMNPKEITLPLVEIFQTVEGEGGKAGFPTTFIRLYNCNLRCTWCDTPYSYAPHPPVKIDRQSTRLNSSHVK